MVTSVHDAGNGDQGGGNERDDDEDCFPDFTAIIHNMELAGQVEGEVAQSRKGGCTRKSVSILRVVQNPRQRGGEHTARVSRRERLESIPQQMRTLVLANLPSKQANRWFYNSGIWVASGEHIRPRLSNRIFHRASNKDGRRNRESEPEHTAVEFP